MSETPKNGAPYRQAPETPAPPPSKARFEYARHTFKWHDEDARDMDLSEMGRDGWRLAAAFSNPNNTVSHVWERPVEVTYSVQWRWLPAKMEDAEQALASCLNTGQEIAAIVCDRAESTSNIVYRAMIVRRVPR